MLIERIEQRVLGALQLVDVVTQTPVRRFLTVSSHTATVVRNRRGLYVVTSALGLEAYTASFAEPPATPAIESNEYIFEINDPLNHYLPRLMTLRLPRDPDPIHLDHDNSLFSPRDVSLYPAATASLSHNWSSVRVLVTRSGNLPVRGALIKILDLEDDAALGSGISDEHGEALVIVPGVPVTKFASDADSGRGNSGGESPVVVNTLPVRLELSLDTTSSWPPNPDRLQQNHASNRRVSMDLVLSTGRMERVVIPLT